MATNPYINRVDIQRGDTTETLINISDTTATAADVSQGAYFYLASGEKVEGTSMGGTMVIRDSQDSHGGTVREITAGTVVQGTKSITANGTYDVAAYADAQVNVPSAEPSLQSKTATPTTAQQTIMPDSGYDGLSSVTVNAVQSGSLRETETYQVAPEISVNSSGLVTASVNQSDTTNPVYSSGWIEDDAAQYVTVSAYSTSQLPTQAAKTVTPSTSAQTAVAAGKYTTGAVTVAAMPTGTAGTPTATKGTVSNHSVSVTPSVTNATGYITGGTKSGTAVTVSASELVSGSQTITANGTVDVTNLASVDVDVQASGSSSYTFIYSTTMSVSTSSTSVVVLDSIETGNTSIWTSSQMVYVKVRDTAGPRNGYFYGTDCMFTNNAPALGLTATTSYLMFGQIYRANALGVVSPVSINRSNTAAAANGYGIYPTHVNNDGSITMKARYDSSYTGTIDGTFSVEVYLLGWPDDESPLYGD